MKGESPSSVLIVIPVTDDDIQEQISFIEFLEKKVLFMGLPLQVVLEPFHSVPRRVHGTHTACSNH